jgi:hypothetical protein
MNDDGERQIAEIEAGSEAIVIVKDQRTGFYLWLRGVTLGGKLFDTNADRFPHFGLSQVSLKAAMTYKPPEFKLDLKVTAQTYTIGVPSDRMLARPIPYFFDAAYFAQAGKGDDE